MKTRELKQLLNNTGYAVHFQEGKICIGSAYISKLLTMDPITGALKYSLDTFNAGRLSLHHAELEFIWDKLAELYERGAIHEIVNNNDDIPNAIVVHTYDYKGNIIYKLTEKNWREINYATTHDGELMYHNKWFENFTDVCNAAIKELSAAVKSNKESIEDAKEKLREKEERCLGYERALNDVISQLNRGPLSTM